MTSIQSFLYLLLGMIVVGFFLGWLTLLLRAVGLVELEGYSDVDIFALTIGIAVAMALLRGIWALFGRKS